MSQEMDNELDNQGLYRSHSLSAGRGMSYTPGYYAERRRRDSDFQETEGDLHEQHGEGASYSTGSRLVHWRKLLRPQVADRGPENQERT